jgi:lactate dehydrogenase-like 2-hydroxyacid dehydrogenase
MKPILLMLTYSIIPPGYMEKFEERFEIKYAPTPEDWVAVAKEPWIKDVRAVFTMGSRGVKRDLLDLMPNLEIACCKGAGYDGFDIPEMNKRGIAMTHGQSINATYVADHSIALMLATVRNVVNFDAAVRRGEWVTGRSLPPSITGKRLGVVGLGEIGSKIAHRCHNGFEMPIGYHTRTPKPDEPFKPYTDVVALARDSDFLMCILPLNDQSRHMINAEVLDALGPEGYLFNMARGPVVENAALIPALQQGKIAGAGLDVVEGEPNIPAELLALNNVTMTPHVGGHVPESARETLDQLLGNLDAHFAGKPVLTPLPGSTAGRATA